MPNNNRRSTTPERLKIRAKEEQALALRMAGVSWRQIAERLGWESPSAPLKAVRRLMDETATEASRELRQMETLRLDRMMEALWPDVLRGKWLAVDRVLKIQERKAMLLGLDAPQKRIVEHITEDAFAAALAAREAAVAELEAAESVPELVEGIDFEEIDAEVEAEMIARATTREERDVASSAAED